MQFRCLDGRKEVKLLTLNLPEFDERREKRRVSGLFLIKISVDNYEFHEIYKFLELTIRYWRHKQSFRFFPLREKWNANGILRSLL